MKCPRRRSASGKQIGELAPPDSAKPDKGDIENDG